MSRRGRRWAAIATVTVVLATGTGVARAYFAPGAVDAMSTGGYFTFCADRQRDTAGITAADLVAANYGIDNYVYDTPGPLVGANLSGGDPFVLTKSGIQNDGTARRAITAQRVEYVDAARTQPAQIRCKMRTRESLVRPETEKQRFDPVFPPGATEPNPPVDSPVSWGFGPAAASLPEKSCRQVQEEIVAAAWASLTPAQQDATPYKYGTASLVLGPETLFLTGSAWTGGQKIVTATPTVLTIADRTLVAISGTPNPFGDRLTGAYYCTFVAPEYIRGVLLGGPVA